MGFICGILEELETVAIVGHGSCFGFIEARAPSNRYLFYGLPAPVAHDGLPHVQKGPLMTESELLQQRCCGHRGLYSRRRCLIPQKKTVGYGGWGRTRMGLDTMGRRSLVGLQNMSGGYHKLSPPALSINVSKCPGP